MDGWAGQERLAGFRGRFPVAPLRAGRVADLLSVPGCPRRQVLDAAAVQLDALATLLGCAPSGSSPFALARARQFARLVTGEEMGAVVKLAREQLGVPVTAVHQADLSAAQVQAEYVRDDPEFRAGLTRGQVRDMLAARGQVISLLRRPVLALPVGGAPIYVEPDLVGYTTTAPLRPVEVREFPCVDGTADPAHVTATTREVAVHVLATGELARRFGYDSARVATTGLLVLPRNFSLTATAVTMDVAPQVRRLRRTLAAFPAPAALAQRVPQSVSLPELPPRDASADQRAEASLQAAEAVSALSPRFGDGCVGCALFRFCRSEQQAAGSVARLGDTVANQCGEVSAVTDALELAHGRRMPSNAAEQAVAADLGRAAVMNNWVRTVADRSA